MSPHDADDVRMLLDAFSIVTGGVTALMVAAAYLYPVLQ
jgi:hypothetical protein